MWDLTEQDINCPYCGETITILIEPEDSGQQYIEDCQVCCKPITFVPIMDDDGEGRLRVTVHDENEAF